MRRSSTRNRYHFTTVTGTARSGTRQDRVCLSVRARVAGLTADHGRRRARLGLTGSVPRTALSPACALMATKGRSGGRLAQRALTVYGGRCWAKGGDAGDLAPGSPDKGKRDSENGAGTAVSRVKPAPVHARLSRHAGTLRRSVIGPRCAVPSGDSQGSADLPQCSRESASGLTQRQDAHFQPFRGVPSSRSSGIWRSSEDVEVRHGPDNRNLEQRGDGLPSSARREPLRRGRHRPLGSLKQRWIS